LVTTTIFTSLPIFPQLMAPEAIAPFVEYVEGERYYESPRLPVPIKASICDFSHDTIVTEADVTDDFTPEPIHASSASLFEIQSDASFLSMGSLPIDPVLRKKR
jgi:hypothetical protein